MNFSKILMPATALGAVALLFATETSQGFTTIGGSLSQAQRDVRLFNNFSKAITNNNVTPHPNWPGYDGAEMAIWKACSEWASQLHGGTGAGDPLQAVGSGGANFDISWQGNATGIGTTNQNTHSQIGGSSGGVLAYCETPISDGWRIRYYEGWNWQDGPGNDGSTDLQGVACHEYGHALGLGHTNVGGATMYPSISGSGVAARSIEADDIAGVQFIYGVKSGSKPTINNVLVNAGNLTINGSNFSPSNNEVWFTQAASGGTGDPIKVTGVTSNGSSITVAIPGTAGPGDVLVRNNGTGNANLSNAWPVDPDAPPPGCIVTNYCQAKLSSNLCVPMIAATGSPSLSAAGGFTFSTTFMEANLPAIGIFGVSGQAAIPFQGGLLCIAGTVNRLVGQFSGGVVPCTGAISYTLQDVLNHPSGGAVNPGGLLNLQTWGRDLGDAFGSSLSDAIEVIICP